MDTSVLSNPVAEKDDCVMTQEMCLANVQLILRDRVMTGWLRVADGQIVEVGEGDRVPRGAIDCSGDFVAPGLIELHTDNLERHIQPRPGVDWPYASAIVAHDAELAATGITSVFDAMRVGSIPSGKGGTEKYARAMATELLNLRAADALKISHFLHLRAEVCSETLIQELEEFGPNDRVGIVSLMDHTPGQRQFRDVTKMKAYVMGKRSMSEAEFEEHVVRLAGLQRRFGAKHEAATVMQARRFGAVLASHDDTTARHVATSAAHGVRLAEFPTTLEAAQACHDRGVAVMMGAPNLIRGGSHSGNVAAQELAERGLLDVVSSDYVPSALLSAAVHLGVLWNDMARGMATVTATPASAVGLADRGSLQVGLRADVIRFRLAGSVPLLRGVWCRGAQVA